MLDNLEKLKEYSDNLENFKGSEINRNFWATRIAENFPKLIKTIEQQNERIAHLECLLSTKQ